MAGFREVTRIAGSHRLGSFVTDPSRALAAVAAIAERELGVPRESYL